MTAGIALDPWTEHDLTCLDCGWTLASEKAQMTDDQTRTPKPDDPLPEPPTEPSEPPLEDDPSAPQTNPTEDDQ